MEAITRTTFFLICTVLLCCGVAGTKGNIDDDIVDDGSGDDDNFVTTDQPYTTGHMTVDDTNTTGGNMTDEFVDGSNSTSGNMTKDEQGSGVVHPTTYGSPPTSPVAALPTSALIGICGAIGCLCLIVIVVVLACKRRRVRSPQDSTFHGKNQAKPLEGDLLEANNGSKHKKKQQEQKTESSPKRHVISTKDTPKKLSSRRKKMNNDMNFSDDDIVSSPGTIHSPLSVNANVLESAMYSNDEPTYSAADGHVMKQQEQKKESPPKRHVISTKDTPKKLSRRRKKMNSGMNFSDDDIVSSAGTIHSTLSGNGNVLESAMDSNDEPTYSAADGHVMVAAPGQHSEDEYGNAPEEVAAAAGQHVEDEYGNAPEEVQLDPRRSINNSASHSPRSSTHGLTSTFMNSVPFDDDTLGIKP